MIKPIRILLIGACLLLAPGCTARRDPSTETTGGVVAFQVELNGELLCTAGIPENHGVVSITTNWVKCDPAYDRATCNPTREPIWLHVGGLTTDLDGGKVFLEWADRHLQVGDELRVKVVRTSDPSPAPRHRENIDDLHGN